MTENADAGPGQENSPLVVATDGSVISRHAVAWAAMEARLRGCPLEIVTSVAVPGAWVPGEVAADAESRWLQRDGDRVLSEAAHIVRATVGDATAITSEVTFEQPVPDLIDRSRRACLLVVGSRGLGAIRRGLLGSVSTAVTRHAHCPVAVVRSTSVIDPVSAEQPVLVGVDGTAGSAPAIELAFEEASRRKVALVALHAWSDTTTAGVPLPNWDVAHEQARELLDARLAQPGRRWPDVRVRRILVRANPVRSLFEASARVQLLVVGSHGRGGFTDMLLGSTASGLLHSVDCPVIVVPSLR